MRKAVGLLALGLMLVAQGASAQETKPAPAPAEKPAAAAPKRAKPAARNDVAVGAALARTDQGFTLSASAPSMSEPVGPKQVAPPVMAHQGGAGLAEIHVATRAVSDGAGEARDVQMTAMNARKTEKPMASIRHHRKLAVAQTTVVFHLKNLFRKTETHRQADLVRVLLSVPLRTGGE